MKKISTLILTFLLSGCGFINFTPQQESLIYYFIPETEPTYISSQEMEEIFPGFSNIGKGEYRLVHRGMVKGRHDAPWCFSGTYGGQNGVNNLSVADVVFPMDWTTSDYSNDLSRNFDGYAFGVALASYEGVKGTQVVNVFLDKDREIILYDPTICQWVCMEVSDISIY